MRLGASNQALAAHCILATKGRSRERSCGVRMAGGAMVHLQGHVWALLSVLPMYCGTHGLSAASNASLARPLRSLGSCT